jgi:hypothetical protein
MSKPIPTNYVAGIIYDALREEVTAVDRRCPTRRHRGCLSNMDKIWELRSTKVHDLFRRVARRVISEVEKERPELRRKTERGFRVVSEDGPDEIGGPR